jgi:hypothetical protein
VISSASTLLNGSASYVPPPVDMLISYLWKLSAAHPLPGTAVPSGGAASLVPSSAGLLAAAATILQPQQSITDVNRLFLGTYEFSLTVESVSHDFSAKNVSISVLPSIQVCNNSTLLLPNTTIVLSADVRMLEYAPAASLQWSLEESTNVSPPQPEILITSPHSATTTVTGLTRPGIYTFRLRVLNETGLQVRYLRALTTVTVKPTIELGPSRPLELDPEIPTAICPSSPLLFKIISLLSIPTALATTIQISVSVSPNFAASVKPASFLLSSQTVTKVLLVAGPAPMVFKLSFTIRGVGTAVQQTAANLWIRQNLATIAPISFLVAPNFRFVNSGTRHDLAIGGNANQLYDNGRQQSVASSFAALLDPFVRWSQKPVEELAEWLSNPSCTPTEAYWLIGNWGACSKSCNGGTRARQVSCISKGGHIVADSTCARAGTKPVTTSACNTFSCTGFWQPEPWSRCSAPCGGGQQYRSVYCVRTEDPTAPPVRVHPIFCLGQTVPPTQQVCHPAPCGTKWNVTGWGTCSIPDGCNLPGWSTRNVTCQGPRGQVFPDSYCGEYGLSSLFVAPKPANVQNCTSICTGFWQPDPWSGCSFPCGGGTQTRSIGCVAWDQTNQYYLPAEECPKYAPAFSTNQICNTDMCAGVVPYWKVSEWSQCSAACDTGFRTRTMECVGSQETPIDPGKCAGLTQPSSQELCNTQRCPTTHLTYEWHASNYSACECGEGWQYREVTCADRDNQPYNPDGRCDWTKQPAYRKRCECKGEQVIQHALPPAFPASAPEQCLCGCSSFCPFISHLCVFSGSQFPVRWYTGDWQRCSQNCTGGIQTRVVACVRTFAGLFDDDGDQSDSHGWRLPLLTELVASKERLVAEARCTMQTRVARPAATQPCSSGIPCKEH